MKTRFKIFIAFILNLFFSIFEFFGGIFTGSVAILSDAVHDFGDAASIGLSFFLEQTSEKKPNNKYTYGYLRFSVLGGFITTLILLVSSGIVIYNAVLRIKNPVIINYDGMLVFAIIGLVINLFATYFTHGGDSINQRAVNLHMLEDVFGWLVVLVGAIIMKFTDFYIIDPILSIIVALFVLISAIKNILEIADMFLIKTPKNINIEEIAEHLKQIKGVIDVHHIHVWSLDGEIHCATLHVVSETFDHSIKEAVKEELKEHGINHITVEMETTAEHCKEINCDMSKEAGNCHHHHHHH